jgi:hypothetical protein
MTPLRCVSVMFADASSCARREGDIRLDELVGGDAVEVAGDGVPGG